MKGYKELKIPIIDKDGKSAWPELFPIERIEELRQSVGNRHFSSQMLLQFVDIEKARLDPDFLKIYDQEFDYINACIGESKITGATAYWDPSSGKKNSDGSVCVLLYKDDNNHRIFIHDILYLLVSEEDMFPLATQCNQVLDFIQRHKLKRISIETNGIGNALPEIIRQIASNRGDTVVVKKVINTKNKESRILDAIEPILNSGRMYVHRRIQSSPLISEMLGFSPFCKYGHDDGIDAVAGAIYETPIPIRPLGQKITKFKANTNFKIL